MAKGSKPKTIFIITVSCKAFSEPGKRPKKKDYVTVVSVNRDENDSAAERVEVYSCGGRKAQKEFHNIVKRLDLQASLQPTLVKGYELNISPDNDFNKLITGDIFTYHLVEEKKKPAKKSTKKPAKKTEKKDK